MRFAIALCFVLVLAVSVSAYADYTLIDKIPAPGYPVTGLASTEQDLFVVTNPDTESHIYLIRPSDGLVLDSYLWEIPYKPSGYPEFTAGAYEGNYVYWVADGAGAYFLRFEWVDAVVTMMDTVTSDRITYPTGMAFQDMGEAMDALWVSDAEEDSLYLMAVNGIMYDAYDLYGIAFMYNLGPSSVSLLANNLFLSSYNYADSLYELDNSGNRMDAHLLPDLGQMSPLATTFHNGLLYVGGDGDSILVYSTGSYADSVPEGSGVVVEIVPEGLEVGFDSVAVAGSLYVEVLEMQPCPPPGAVVFFSEYYDVSTTAQFEYITQVMLMTDEPLPGGINPSKVRVFVRPSGECTFWRDITVALTEIVPPPGDPDPFRVNTRTLSEDDEFSMFVLGEDRRSPATIINLKFGYLETAIVENQDSIPVDTYNLIVNLLDDAETAFGNHRNGRAAALVDRIADIVRETAAIPHSYDPQTGRVNVAGRIISRAHTLSFSLRLVVQQNQFAEGGPVSYKDPAVDIIGSSQDHAVVLIPNPSRSRFTIELSSAVKHPVSVSVYSVEGELVRVLMDGATLSGRRILSWDGRNDRGVPVAAGTYFVVVDQGESTVTKKMILQR